ncbi:hypothetical protein ACJRO7_022785 [Eucalyptus globulus]|uniref:Uncharacterized protein n=1 Tax=Eucalyptus globulus TaxID=34317 RepID=A0ABD3K6A4_EUCGL
MSRPHRCLFKTVCFRHTAAVRSPEKMTAATPTPKPRRASTRRSARLGHDVFWGMELAAFSHPQIKSFLRYYWEKKIRLGGGAILSFHGLRRLGLDVREGKRTSSPLWKLLREVEPELMDALIEATKDGDHSRLRALSVSEVWFGKDDDEGEEVFEQEQEKEECREYSSIASRWFDGLISKDIQMANEVFSIHTIDFDRQDLRKIVWRVQSTQEQPAKNKREASIALLRAQKSSTCFLRNLARQLCCSNT